MIRHVAGFAEIVEDVETAVRFYRDVLGLEVEYQPGEAYANVKVSGTLHFGLWARAAAAESTFGDASAIDRIPLGFTIGFEVDSVETSHQETAGRGLTFSQPPRTEPWGQVTARFFSPSGALCEFSETPWARQITQNLKADSEGG